MFCSYSSVCVSLGFAKILLEVLLLLVLSIGLFWCPTWFPSSRLLVSDYLFCFFFFYILSCFGFFSFLSWSMLQIIFLMSLMLWIVVAKLASRSLRRESCYLNHLQDIRNGDAPTLDRNTALASAKLVETNKHPEIESE